MSDAKKNYFFNLPQIQPGTELEMFALQTGDHAEAAEKLAERFEECARRCRLLAMAVKGKEMDLCGEVQDIWLRANPEDLAELVPSRIVVETQEEFADEIEVDLKSDWDSENGDDGMIIHFEEDREISVNH